MAKKRQLLDVLRQREAREAGLSAPSTDLPDQLASLPRVLPPQFLVLGAVLVLALLVIWAGCSFFGSAGGSGQAPTVAAEQVESSVLLGVLARVYDPARLNQAQKEGSALQALGYDVVLVQVEDPSGNPQLQLFVGSARQHSALEPLLQSIQALSLDGQPSPFAGASIQPQPPRP